MARIPAGWLIRLTLVALAYGVAARLSLGLALVHGQVTPIWPPTGIALVAFLLLGWSVWPAIALAAFVVNLPLGPSALVAAGIAVGNTLAPLAAAVLLDRVGFHRHLDRLGDALAIIFLGALGGMAISATIGTSVLFAGGAIAAGQLLNTWAVWWTGDAMGVLLVAPFLLSLLSFNAPPLQGVRRGAELVGLLTATALVTYLLFLNDLRLEYLVLPLIMAAAWRFHLRGAAPAALIASGVAVACAAKGIGPFAEETLLEKMITLQVFNVSLAMASFVLAAFVETRQRKEEMARLYAAARSANEEKSRFLHLAAHELRTPVSVLFGYVSMLADGTLGAPPDQWKKPLDVLATKTKELSRLVSDLLEASRTQANAMARVVTQLDLRQAASEALERARPRAELLGGEVSLAMPIEAVWVEADAIQIGRILDNLINNALTYTLARPQVSLRVSSDHQSAAVRVVDNGVGVSVEERERVFQQFHRTNDPAFSNVPGTGLGLYISRQLAEANGGMLAIEQSSADQGTVFLLSLPTIDSPVIVEAADAALASIGRAVSPEHRELSRR